MAEAMYRSKRRRWRGKRIDTSQSHEVRLCLLDLLIAFSWLESLTVSTRFLSL